ncbi:MAG: FAD/NAD(P)-binding protein [Bacteroidetes bacterium]|nr:FAD/NAD(P)-binding protein [Bacteroidota bacterium]
MNKIAIIGCGFSGTMTAVHLVNNSVRPFELILIGKEESFNKGIAYNPCSKKQLLNVTAGRMSAFGDRPDHFLQWVLKLEEYSGTDPGLLANTYLPRYLYGGYLEEIWREAAGSPAAQKVRITRKDSMVLDMEVAEDAIALVLDNGEVITAQFCVLASGNNLPGNPGIADTHFLSSRNYFRNPWDARAVMDKDPEKPVLILGNGLSMVDTVLGLLENGFRSNIYTISPHGFTMLPHRHTGIVYTAILKELNGKQGLREIVAIVTKHVRMARKLGFTAEPVIDAIRPLTQQLWQNLSPAEKQLFMARIRHLWDSARHRIPMHMHDRMQQLADAGILTRYTGKLTGISKNETGVNVQFVDFKQNSVKEITVSGVINCTGPATDLMKAEESYLTKCLLKGTVVQDDLKLGIMANPVSYEVHSKSGEPWKNLLATGSLLKGVLGESSAVKELREQAESVAKLLVSKMQGSSGS